MNTNNRTKTFTSNTFPERLPGLYLENQTDVMYCTLSLLSADHRGSEREREREREMKRRRCCKLQCSKEQITRNMKPRTNPPNPFTSPGCPINRLQRGMLPKGEIVPRNKAFSSRLLTVLIYSMSYNISSQ